MRLFEGKTALITGAEGVLVSQRPVLLPKQVRL